MMYQQCLSFSISAVGDNARAARDNQYPWRLKQRWFGYENLNKIIAILVSTDSADPDH